MTEPEKAQLLEALRGSPMREKLARFFVKHDLLVAEHEERGRQLTGLREAVRARSEAEAGDAWAWVGDSTDDLDSMGDGMTVAIRAGQLRELIGRVGGSEDES